LADIFVVYAHVSELETGKRLSIALNLQAVCIMRVWVGACNDYTKF